MNVPGAVATAVVRICEHLVATGANGATPSGGTVVVFTAKSRGEGVTSVATAVARHLVAAQGCRVLLVDAAADGGGEIGRLVSGGPAGVVVRALSFPVEPGPDVPDGAVVDVLRWQEAGGDAVAPADLVADLRPRYDVILVDAGTLGDAAPLRWARCAGQVVLVVDGNRTTVEALTRLGRELDHANVQLTGVILNKRRYWVPDFLYRFLY